ncbi:MAG: hypothetical protein OEW58_10095 [Gammaproteobacteria bacterium]|nr:hypothetical protein [Gammaproteobacteria bacterium]
MTKVTLRLMTAPILVIATMLAGCATTPWATLPDRNIAVETIDSGSTGISHAFLSYTKKAIYLRGELERKIAGRGPAPGHLHVELLDKDGNVLKVAMSGYERKNLKSDVAYFTIPIPVDLPALSKVRLRHHDIVSHQETVHDVQWQEPGEATSDEIEPDKDDLGR